MINPSSNVCRKCGLQWAIFIPRDVVGLISSAIQVDDISSDILFSLIVFRRGQSKLYWTSGSAFMLMPYGPTIFVFQRIKNDYLHIQQAVSMSQMPGCMFI